MARQEIKKVQAIDQPRRGDIYLVNFDPTMGAEIRKTRPAVVIQNNVANRFSPIVIVAAITSKFDVPPYPTDVILDPAESGLGQESAVVLNQIRSIDKQRLVRRVGRIDRNALHRVDRAILISLGLVDTST